MHTLPWNNWNIREVDRNSSTLSSSHALCVLEKLTSLMGVCDERFGSRNDSHENWLSMRFTVSSGGRHQWRNKMILCEEHHDISDVDPDKEMINGLIERFWTEFFKWYQVRDVYQMSSAAHVIAHSMFGGSTVHAHGSSMNGNDKLVNLWFDRLNLNLLKQACYSN